MYGAPSYPLYVEAPSAVPALEVKSAVPLAPLLVEAPEPPGEFVAMVQDTLRILYEQVAYLLYGSILGLVPPQGRRFGRLGAFRLGGFHELGAVARLRGLAGELLYVLLERLGLGFCDHGLDLVIRELLFVRLVGVGNQPPKRLHDLRKRRGFQESRTPDYHPPEVRDNDPVVPLLGIDAELA